MAALRLLIALSLLPVPLASARAEALRRIEDVPAIGTWHLRIDHRVGADPPLQTVAVEGDFGSRPERYDYTLRLGEGGREAARMQIRRVEGKLYRRMNTVWAEIPKFHLEESTILTAEQLLGVAGRLEEVGRETLFGREVRHLRGGKAALPVLRGGSDTLDFSRMDSAQLDLWVDAAERFIVKIRIEAQATQRGETLPLVMVQEYSAFNEPLDIRPPAEGDIVRVSPPPSLGQDEVTAELGFDFPVPEGAQVSIYGATVNLITALPLAAARDYADRHLRAAGFAAVETQERATGEYYTDWVKGERKLGVLVFQVSPRGATIQLGALK